MRKRNVVGLDPVKNSHLFWSSCMKEKARKAQLQPLVLHQIYCTLTCVSTCIRYCITSPELSGTEHSSFSTLKMVLEVHCRRGRRLYSKMLDMYVTVYTNKLGWEQMILQNPFHKRNCTKLIFHLYITSSNPMYTIQFQKNCHV